LGSGFEAHGEGRMEGDREMRSKWIAVALIALGFAWVSTPASAALITMNVTGGAGIDVGDICLTTNGCPTTPAFTLSANVNPLTGTLVYDNVANTLSFTLVNSAAVGFGPAPFPALAAGQTFTGSAPVLSLPLGGGAVNLLSNGPGSATAPTVWSSLTNATNTPTVTSVNCTVGTGADQCGLAFGPSGWTVHDAAGALYNVYLVINLNTVPVPEPGTIALVGMGLAGLVVAGRRRRV
jgi:hypothetical protein